MNLIQKKLTGLNTLMYKKNIPATFHNRLREYCEYLLKSNIKQNYSQLIDNFYSALPPAISLYINRMLFKLPEIQPFDSYLNDFSSLLRYITVLPNEHIIKSGEISNSLFYIISGEIKVDINENTIIHLYSGAIFGELASINPKIEIANFTTVSRSEIFSINKNDFDVLKNKYSNLIF